MNYNYYIILFLFCKHMFVDIFIFYDIIFLTYFIGFLASTGGQIILRRKIFMKKSFIRSWFEMEVLKNKLRYVLAFIILPAFLAFCVAISKASNTTDSVVLAFVLAFAITFIILALIVFVMSIFWFIIKLIFF